MRINITLEGKQPIVLPLHYNHLLQGLIYHQLEQQLASWLHEHAYRQGKRKFTMFTFSRLQGQYHLDKRQQRFCFASPIRFQLASINNSVLTSLAERLLASQHVRLGNNTLTVQGIEIIKPPQLHDNRPTRVRTLSPITIHSTFDKPNGASFTHYYHPFEDMWSDMLLDNLRRKAAALNWQENMLGSEHYIRKHRVGERDHVVPTYKGFVINAWLGEYELKLPQGYLELALDTGLGARNAQGFGMVEVL